MDIKQFDSGTFMATFKADELPIVVRAVNAIIKADIQRAADQAQRASELAIEAERELESSAKGA